MKRAIVLLVAFVATFSLNTVSASAAIDSAAINVNSADVELFWVNASTIALNIGYSGSTATCTGVIRGNANVNRITATFTLKRVNSNGSLSTVKTWTGLTSSTSSLTFSGTYSPVSKGQTYRLEVLATLTTTSGVRETVSDYIIKTY